ncbi:MAG: OmpA family protein [Planctomycetaceae bacterium]|nr:OmpA family protein [Planctomycetaceae bacterium]
MVLHFSRADTHLHEHRFVKRLRTVSMLTHQKFINTVIALTFLSGLTGCHWSGNPRSTQLLRASHRRSQELFAENEQLLMAQNNLQQTVSGLEQDRQMLSQSLGQSESQLSAANSRIDNLLAERGELKDRYAAVLKDTYSDGLSIAGSSTVPGFQYDALSGLNKFPDDIRFDLGSADLRPEAFPVLREFAQKVNSGSAAGLRILIVGHTDDQRIVRPGTAAKHATNWHLSTDRADQVITELEKLGVASDRMASMGYSRYRPLEASTSEPSRQRNRRVELFVIPETGPMAAAWDPARSVQ